MTDISLIDIGANLTHESFADDLESVLSRAKEIGIKALLVTGSDATCSTNAWHLTQQYSNVFSTAGFHPHHAKDFTSDGFEVIQELAKKSSIKAIGETGLDFYRNFSTPAQQEKVFIAHIELAIELKKPLFLHQRDAHQRFLAILKSERDHLQQVVVHCFTGTKQELFDYLDLDFHIGITGWICDERRGLHLHDFLHEIPLNRIMVETDSPYLLPRKIQPKPKTRRNEPAYLVYVLEKLSQCYGLTEAELAKHCWQNTIDFFELSQDLSDTIMQDKQI